MLWYRLIAIMRNRVPVIYQSQPHLHFAFQCSLSELHIDHMPSSQYFILSSYLTNPCWFGDQYHKRNEGSTAPSVNLKQNFACVCLFSVENISAFVSQPPAESAISAGVFWLCMYQGIRILCRVTPSQFYTSQAIQHCQYTDILLREETNALKMKSSQTRLKIN